MTKPIVFIILTLAAIKVNTANIPNNTKKEIDTLEKEKSQLLNLINEAINDTVKALELINDTESVQGVNFMKDLRLELKKVSDTYDTDQLNVTENCSEETSLMEIENTTRTKDARRNARNEKLKLEILDFAKLYKKKFLVTKKEYYKDRREDVQKKIDDWIEERKKEKAKIKEYKKKERDYIYRMKPEQCPDHGTKKGGSKKKGKGKENGVKNPKYPCCRKCCKKSYMGCL